MIDLGWFRGIVRELDTLEAEAPGCAASSPTCASWRATSSWTRCPACCERPAMDVWLC
jgi:hypothetical protein